MHLKVSSAKWRSFRFSPSMLTQYVRDNLEAHISPHILFVRVGVIQQFDPICLANPIYLHDLLSVREITKCSSTFSATNISSNIVWLLQLHDTIQTKTNFGTKFSSIYLAKWEKHLFFRLSFVNLQRAKDYARMFDAKYRYVFVV